MIKAPQYSSSSGQIVWTLKNIQFTTLTILHPHPDPNKHAHIDNVSSLYGLPLKAYFIWTI